MSDDSLNGESALSMLRRACRLNPPLFVTKRLHDMIIHRCRRRHPHDDDDDDDDDNNNTAITMNNGDRDFTGTPIYYAIQSHSSCEVIEYLQNADASSSSSSSSRYPPEPLAVMTTTSPTYMTALEYALYSRASLDVVVFILDGDPARRRTLLGGSCILTAIESGAGEDVILYLMEEYLKLRSDVGDGFGNDVADGSDVLPAVVQLSTAEVIDGECHKDSSVGDDADLIPNAIALSTADIIYGECHDISTFDQNNLHAIPVQAIVIPDDDDDDAPETATPHFTNNIFTDTNEFGEPLLTLAVRCHASTPVISKIISASGTSLPQILSTRRADTGDTALSTAIKRNASHDTIQCLLHAADGAALSPPVIDSLRNVFAALPPYELCHLSSDGGSRAVGGYRGRRGVFGGRQRVAWRLPLEQEIEFTDLLSRARQGVGRRSSEESRLSEEEERTFRRLFGTLSARVQDCQRSSSSSRRNRDNDPPRTWEKLTLVLKAASGWYDDRLGKGRRRRPFRMLHALSSCPPLAENVTLLRFVMTLYPLQVRQADDDDGNLPLHLISSIATTTRGGTACTYHRGSGTTTSARIDIVPALTLLMNSFPPALGRANKKGQLPLHCALESGKTWYDGVEVLVRAYPAALGVSCGGGVHPFVSAALQRRKCLTTLYLLLRECPELLRDCC